MVERRPGFIKRHTQKGRYEEYLAKHAHLVAQAQGEARYLFEKKLDIDAKRYARRAVALDMLTLAILTTGTVLIGREIKNGTLGTTLESIPRNLIALAERVKSEGIAKTNAVLQHVGREVAVGAAGEVEAHLPVMLETIREHAPAIGQAAANGMLAEVGQSLPAMGDALQKQLEGAGVVIAANIMATVESGLPHMAETFAASLRSIPGMVLFGKGKK